MNDSSAFKKHYSRLRKEGILKSLIFSLIAGLCVSIITALIALINNFSGTLLSLLACIVITVLLLPIFYLLIFKPTFKMVVERLDRLGLEERLITMVELENDQSYIAMRQREDAKNKLSILKGSSVPIRIFRMPIIALFLLLTCSLTMVTISALSVEDKIPWFPYEDSVVIPTEPDCNYYVVEYIVYLGSGYIGGDSIQIVVEGEDAEPVIAVPYEGWAFLDWFDTRDATSESSYRWDKEITADFYAFARFVPIEEGDGNDDKNEQPQDRPKPGEDSNKEFDPNLIIDGSIYYRDEEIFFAYFEKVMQQIINGHDVPPELIDLVQRYFESLK